MPTTADTPAHGPRPAGRAPRLWFVGALPPPLNGQSNCNRAMLDALRARGADIRLHDIGGSTASKLSGVARAIAAILRRGRRGDRAYLSVPGQMGAWLFVPLARALRWRGIDHVVHHHSFRAINLGPLAAMRRLVAAGGDRQRHLLLSAAMRRRFAELYLPHAPERAESLSNAHLFGPRTDSPTTRPDRPVTLGHLSVLTREKGVSHLLRLFEAMMARGHDGRLVIAGPCADPTLAEELTRAASAHPGRIEWRGAVAGQDKERFFRDIDLFVLPTTLIDEAEPLVMLEAYGKGVDVVANDTGCIRDRIRTPGHLLPRDIEGDCRVIAARIGENAADWSAARAACIDHVRAIKAMADAEAETFFARLLGGTAPGS